jgi:RNA polymerase sigma-70 factor (ECF subfamily)
VSLKSPLDNSLMIEGISIGHMDTRILKFASEIAAQGEKAQVTLRDQVTEIYEDLRADVFRYLVLIGVAPAEAQDVCQEVFLRLYSALVKGQRIDNQRAWIFTVAHNCGVHARSDQSALVEFDAAIEQQLVSEAPHPEKAVLDREKMLRVHHAVSALSHQQRQCLYLRAEGFRYREIAEILGVASSTVGEFLQRAIIRLRKALYE